MNIHCNILQAELSQSACQKNIQLAIEAAIAFRRSRHFALVRDIAIDRLMRCGQCGKCRVAIAVELGDGAEYIRDEVMEKMRGEWEWAYAEASKRDLSDYDVQQKAKARRWKEWVNQEGNRERRREYMKKWQKARAAAKRSL
jgi:hypothetical protein